jgi:hypothetical protein
MKNLSITNGFTKIGDSRLAKKAQQVYEAMNGNPHFPDPVPSMPALAQAISVFTDSLEACRFGDRLKAAAKNQKRQLLTDAMHQLADYVLFKSAGDIAIAVSSGFSVNRQRAPAPPIARPENLRVEPGLNSGELVNKINRVKGALAYLYQYATDAMMEQGHWASIPCSRTVCTLTNLQPGIKYNCRVSVIGPKDQFVHGDVISRIVA